MPTHPKAGKGNAEADEFPYLVPAAVIGDGVIVAEGKDKQADRQEGKIASPSEQPRALLFQFFSKCH